MSRKPLEPFGPYPNQPAQPSTYQPPTIGDLAAAHMSEHKPFGRKHMKRTCKHCKHSWYVPWALRNLKVATPSAMQRAFTPRYKLEDMREETQLALGVATCRACGSGNYTQRQVRI